MEKSGHAIHEPGPSKAPKLAQRQRRATHTTFQSPWILCCRITPCLLFARRSNCSRRTLRERSTASSSQPNMNWRRLSYSIACIRHICRASLFAIGRWSPRVNRVSKASRSSRSRGRIRDWRSCDCSLAARTHWRPTSRCPQVLPGFFQPVERCRPGHPDIQRSSGRIRQAELIRSVLSKNDK